MIHPILLLLPLCRHDSLLSQPLNLFTTCGMSASAASTAKKGRGCWDDLRSRTRRMSLSYKVGCSFGSWIQSTTPATEWMTAHWTITAIWEARSGWLSGNSNRTNLVHSRWWWWHWGPWHLRPVPRHAIGCYCGRCLACLSSWCRWRWAKGWRIGCMFTIKWSSVLLWEFVWR